MGFSQFEIVIRPLEIFLLLQCGDQLWTSEYDVYRCLILTTEVDSCAVRVKECRGLFFLYLIRPLLISNQSSIISLKYVADSANPHSPFIC